MARIEYQAEDLQGEVADRIRQRRGGRLRELDRMLLHSPPLADGWNSMMGAVRDRSTLPADLRELAMLRIAALNRAAYEWAAHEPIGRAAGLTDADLAALGRDAAPDGLTPVRRAVRDYTDAMTLDVQVPPDVFDALREHFDERGIVELTITIGAYNLVSRFLVALDVGEHAPDDRPDPLGGPGAGA